MNLLVKILGVFLLLFVIDEANAQTAKKKYVMVIHGGAGTILKKNMTEEKESEYRDVLTKALLAGYQKLKANEPSIIAVESAIRILEDSPLFNAGKGAVFTNEGKNELDASIMDGRTLKAGAVAGVTIIKNPISAARAVMEQSEHVMMVGAGAEKFAGGVGLELVDPEYFKTEERWNSFRKIYMQDSVKNKNENRDRKSIITSSKNQDEKFGTVGAVALDASGNLAAGTSTGGMTNKRFGRVGDSPIIGAGTYAKNGTVAVSATGWGEFFIRNVVAYDISALMEYKKMSVTEAAEAVINKVAKAGGDGGVIALDSKGNIATTFNTAGMFRGAITTDGKVEIKIYKE